MSGSDWEVVGCKRGALDTVSTPPNLCAKTSSTDSWLMTGHLQGRRSKNLENQHFHTHVYEREKELRHGMWVKFTKAGNSKAKRLVGQLWSNSYYSQDSNTPRSNMESLNSLSAHILDIVWELSGHAWNDPILQEEWTLDNIVSLLALAAIYQATWKGVSILFCEEKTTINISRIV